MTASTQAERSAYLERKCGFVDDFNAGPKAFCAFTSALAMFLFIGSIFILFIFVCLLFMF